MRKKEVFIFFLTVLILFIIPISPKASHNELVNRDGVMQFLELAFHQQVALSEKVRSMEEIKELLNPYFSQDYQQKFLEANLYEEDEKYCTYGTDFGQYFVPYLRFSEKTEVVIEPSQIYVYEHFERNHEGPVGYDDHYEGILLEKIKGEWKITAYLYNEIPKRIIDHVQLEKLDNEEHKKVSYIQTENIRANNVEKQSKQSLNPLSAILPSRSIFSFNSQNPIHFFIFVRKINHRFSLLL